MPRCKGCGNRKKIASSLFPPASATANAPPYGLIANFDNNGAITTMECQGADLDDAQVAFENPPRFFNTCPFCGSCDIEWQV
ncbi:MAG: hypothetical protein K6U74_16785 [Firmicutes bacterium]|nr:hypothetical protein [Bacillota bacterium]